MSGKFWHCDVHNVTFESDNDRCPTCKEVGNLWKSRRFDVKQDDYDEVLAMDRLEDTNTTMLNRHDKRQMDRIEAKLDKLLAQT